MIKVKRKQFKLLTSVINVPMSDLPEDDYVYKMISDGGFSSSTIINFVAKRATINNLYVTTLRVGKKELKMLDLLHRQGKLGKCSFVVGSIMRQDSKTGLKYKYYENFEQICKNNGWQYRSERNHSKIILFDTDKGKYVLETSSNLNENPKIEQFSFEKNEELFGFYYGKLFQ